MKTKKVREASCLIEAMQGARPADNLHHHLHHHLNANSLIMATSKRLTTLMAVAATCICLYALVSSQSMTCSGDVVQCAIPLRKLIWPIGSHKNKTNEHEYNNLYVRSDLPLTKASASSSMQHNEKDQHGQKQLSSSGNVAMPTSAVQDTPTNLSHIVFGIAAASPLWNKRKEYIKLWWKPRQMRGYVWLDKNVSENGTSPDASLLPEIMVSSNTDKFKYTNRIGRRSAIRISRIVSETVRLGLKDVRWFVMGDDDTVFVVENLIRVLQKYDHREMYYIGSTSESHLQNLMFSYNMAYGGGGFAISYPLAMALEKIQDACLARYPALFGSDDRIQACMAELGVPLTREPGFHQYDVYGNLLGLLATHPLAPAVTLHHLDVFDSVFPNMTKLDALKRLKMSMDNDPAYFIQQSICYDKERRWSISVSWGYVVQVYRGIFTPRELELPPRTFYNWHKKADYRGFAFNTRPFFKHPCQRPFLFYMKNITSTQRGDVEWIESHYEKEREQPPDCKWSMASPETVVDVMVVKKKDDDMWAKGPRRKCCHVSASRDDHSPRFLEIDVHDCRLGELAII